MTEHQAVGESPAAGAGMNVFAAAEWFDSLWNSSARAVSAAEIEWQCTTWGSGRGRGVWEETAHFLVVAEVLGLRTSRNYDGRDELIVSIPLDRFSDVVQLLDRLGEEAEDWPWLYEEDVDAQMAVAAAVLGLSPDALQENDHLLEVLRLI